MHNVIISTLSIRFKIKKAHQSRTLVRLMYPLYRCMDLFIHIGSFQRTTKHGKILDFNLNILNVILYSIVYCQYFFFRMIYICVNDFSKMKYIYDEFTIYKIYKKKHRHFSSREIYRGHISLLACDSPVFRAAEELNPVLKQSRFA